MQKWFWARGGDRRGPVTLEQIRGMIASGEIQPADLAWTAGMPSWKPVPQIPELAPPAPAKPAAPRPATKLQAIKPPPQPPVHVPPAPAVVSTPKPQPKQPKAPVPEPVSEVKADEEHEEIELPPRAEQNLVGHARPTGNAGEWPLGDLPFEQMQTALELRKRIYGAAQLYFWLLVLTLALILVGGISVAARHFGPAGRGATEPVILLFILGFMIGICVVCGIAYYFTLRSHRWAPLTVMILCLLTVGMNVFFLMMRHPDFSSGISDDLIATTALAFFGIFFAGMSWRAFTGIPKYLEQPAWCQELIAAAKL